MSQFSRDRRAQASSISRTFFGALENGFTEMSVVQDAPVSIRPRRFWSRHNYKPEFLDRDAATALQKS